MRDWTCTRIARPWRHLGGRPPQSNLVALRKGRFQTESRVPRSVMAEVTDNVVVSGLDAVLRDHGWLVVRNPERLRASLSDVLGSYADSHRSLIDALVVSAE